MEKKKRKLKLVKIKEEYLDYLRNYESRISYTKEEKIRRPFVGVLFKIEDMLYYAPLTHIEKDSNETNIRINDNSGKFKGYILFNNMIPVNKDDIINYDISKESDHKYKNIVYSQMLFLRKNYNKVVERALNVYKGIIKKEHKSVCFDFKELEKHCKEYNTSKRYNELLEKYNYYTHNCKLGQDELKKAFENKTMDEKIRILQNKVAKFEPVENTQINKNILKQ